MLPQFTLKTGQITGREHLFYAKNCQDALRWNIVDIGGHHYHIAYICDGCSKGKYSEVGAGMAAEFLLKQTIKLLTDGIPLEILPIFLHEDLLGFLRINLESQPLSNPREQSIYINDYLLFSIIGFVLREDKGIILGQGDGLAVINDDVFLRDYNDLPPYLGYLLVDHRHLLPGHSLINESFDIYEIDVPNIKKLAIGSDVWLNEQSLIPSFWGHKHPNQIQRLMNLWSDRDKRLSDDASVVVVEPIQE
jgi:hypothetical protein